VPDESVSFSRVKPLMQLNLVGTFLDVRLALQRLRQVLTDQGICDDDAGRTEIVLAEVLNNIVEHAFSGRTDRGIQIDVVADDGHLRIAVTDEGQPMPRSLLPHNMLTPNPSEYDTLPEGGFGWFMIRDLAKDLAYSRCGGRNHLSFAMELGELGAA
jgi:serine/threonine-protein kinase RsbW